MFINRSGKSPFCGLVVLVMIICLLAPPALKYHACLVLSLAVAFRIITHPCCAHFHFLLSTEKKRRDARADQPREEGHDHQGREGQPLPHDSASRHRGDVGPGPQDRRPAHVLLEERHQGEPEGEEGRVSVKCARDVSASSWMGSTHVHCRAGSLSLSLVRAVQLTRYELPRFISPAMQCSVCWAICKAREQHLRGHPGPYRDLIPDGHADADDDDAVANNPILIGEGWGPGSDERSGRKRRADGRGGDEGPEGGLSAAAVEAGIALPPAGKRQRRDDESSADGAAHRPPPSLQELQRRLVRSREETNRAIRLREMIEAAAALRRGLREERDRRAELWTRLVSSLRGDESVARARINSHMDGSNGGVATGVAGATTTDALVEEVREQDDVLASLAAQHAAVKAAVDVLLLPPEEEGAGGGDEGDDEGDEEHPQEKEEEAKKAATGGDAEADRGVEGEAAATAADVVPAGVGAGTGASVDPARDPPPAPFGLPPVQEAVVVAQDEMIRATL